MSKTMRLLRVMMFKFQCFEINLLTIGYIVQFFNWTVCIWWDCDGKRGVCVCFGSSIDKNPEWSKKFSVMDSLLLLKTKKYHLTQLNKQKT